MIELNEAHGARKFVQHVNADDANKWIALGEFEASPPLGPESLQLIASTQDIVSRIPKAQYDHRSELWLIQGNPSSVVQKTRALKPKKSKQTLTAEDTLTFTTLITH